MEQSAANGFITIGDYMKQVDFNKHSVMMWIMIITFCMGLATIAALFISSFFQVCRDNGDPTNEIE
jgi:hypothetical protein